MRPDIGRPIETHRELDIYTRAQLLESSMSLSEQLLGHKPPTLYKNPSTSPTMTPTSEMEVKPRFPDTTTLLKYLYQDVRHFDQIASDDIILHAVDRDLSTPPRPPVRGIVAVQAHVEALVAATGGTLAMDVSSITANDHFGVALGTLRASREGAEDLVIPVCGVWKFKDGLAIEHWENAHDAVKMKDWIAKGNGSS